VIADRAPRARPLLRLVLSGALVVVTLISAAPSYAQARRTVVIISPGAGTDPALADNLSEVIIARLARSGDELLGPDELSAHLGGPDRADVRACVQDARCLKRVAGELGAARAAVGEVAIGRGGYTFHLSLRASATGSVINEASRDVRGSLGELIRAAQDASDEVMRLRLEAPRELAPSLALAPPGAHPPASRARRRWPSFVVWGAGLAGAAALTAGGVLAFEANNAGVFPDRETAMHDLVHRQELGRDATGLVVVGVLLELAAAANLIVFHEDVLQPATMR
jgi:hypothetical protein